MKSIHLPNCHAKEKWQGDNANRLSSISDQYPVPRRDDAFDCLTGSKWFSLLDLGSGYYQVEMSEEDNEKPLFALLDFFSI